MTSSEYLSTVFDVSSLVAQWVGCQSYDLGVTSLIYGQSMPAKQNLDMLSTLFARATTQYNLEPFSVVTLYSWEGLTTLGPRIQYIKVCEREMSNTYLCSNRV